MTGNGYHVDPDRLRAFAGSIAQVRARIHQVIDAGTQVTPAGWNNAFGLACQAFPAALAVPVQHQLAIIAKLDGALGTTMTKLQQTATDYAQQDQSNSQKLDRVHEHHEQHDVHVRHVQHTEFHSSFHERLGGE